MLLGAGRLPDGTRFTIATFASANGEAVIFQGLYPATIPGSVAGIVSVHAAVPLSDTNLGGTLSWLKPSLASEPVDLTVDGAIQLPVGAVKARR